MDHVVYLNANFHELEDLIGFNKSMIARGASGIKIPHGSVAEGDTLYFINGSEDSQIKACGIVESVYCSDILTVEESFETIIRNQDRLQLPDNQFEEIAGKQILVLVGISNVREISPFTIDMSILTDFGDWIPVGNIEKFKLNLVTNS